MNNPYHHNSNKGLLLDIFNQTKSQATVLDTKEVSLLLMITKPSRAMSNYEVGSTLASMKEVERVSRKGITPARWAIKEEVL